MFDVALPLAGKTVFAPAIVLLGLAVGFLTGLFGVGGGFLLTPALRILFGIPYPVAVGSDLLQIFFTGSFSAWKHHRKGNVDAKMGFMLAGGAILGTELGKRIMDVLERHGGTTFLFGREHLTLDLTLNILFITLMSAIAVSILREAASNNPADDAAATSASSWLRALTWPPRLPFPRSRIDSLSAWVPPCLGLCAGILTGLMGVGGGIVMFPILVYLIGVPTVTAVGTSAFMVVFASGYGTLTHMRANHVEPLLVAMLLAGSLIGVHFGVFVSHRLGGRRIRKYFAAVLALGVLMIVVSLVCPFGK